MDKKYNEDVFKYLSLLMERVEAPNPSYSSIKYRKYIERAIYVGLMAVPIPLSDITLYIMRSQNFTCRKRCFQKYKEQRSHDLCYLKCEEDSCKFVVRLLEKELKRCERNHFNNNKKKRKCKKQVYKMLKQWKGRQVKAHIKLIQSNKMLRIKARLKQKALNK